MIIGIGFICVEVEVVDVIDGEVELAIVDNSGAGFGVTSMSADDEQFTTGFAPIKLLIICSDGPGRSFGTK